LKKVRHTPQAAKIGKVFYFIIFLALLARAISYFAMAIEMINYDSKSDDKNVINDLLEKIFLSLYYIPDIFVVLSFSIYGWLVFMVFFLGLAQLNAASFALISIITLNFLMLIPARF